MEECILTHAFYNVFCGFVFHPDSAPPLLSDHKIYATAPGLSLWVDMRISFPSNVFKES